MPGRRRRSGQSPGTHDRALTPIAEASADDVDAAVRAAREAFDKGPWPRMTPNERAQILSKIARLFERERDRFAYLEAMDMGKPIAGGYGHLAQGIFAWDYFAGKSRDQSDEFVRVAAGTHFTYRIPTPLA